MWFVYMTPMTQSNTSCPSLSQNQCFDFNYRDSCFRTHCAYLHQCIRCNDKHPLIRCIDTQTHTYPNFKQSFRGQGIAFRPSQFQSIYQPRQVSPQSRHVTLQSRQMDLGRYPNKDPPKTKTFNQLSRQKGCTFFKGWSS